MMNPETPDMILNVNKPAGLTSYDVVRKVKRMIKGVKIGHGGTLDPFADGVLLILIGKATKQMPDLLKYRKRYHASLKLGAATETGDNTAPVTTKADIPQLSEIMLRQIEKDFSGEITQTPPQYSAKKVNGRPAYKYAREGKTVDLKPIKIKIHDLKLTPVKEDLLELDVTCSSGTYIRALGEDIAKALGTCGHLIGLTRTAIGKYRLKDSKELEKLPELITVGC